MPHIREEAWYILLFYHELMRFIIDWRTYVVCTEIFPKGQGFRTLRSTFSPFLKPAFLREHCLEQQSLLGETRRKSIDGAIDYELSETIDACRRQIANNLERNF